MPSSTSTCCTCASLLSDTKIPRDHKSEKPLAFDRHLECCQRIICAACQYKNPRFQNYCPFCQISSEPSALPKNGLRMPPAYTKTGTKGEETSLRTQLATIEDAPPPYTPTSIDTPTSPRRPPQTSSASEATHTVDNDPSAAQDTIHHLSPNDTLSSLSLAYKVPISILQAHNNLFSSILLAGRKTVKIPATHYQGPPLSNPPDPVEERRKVRVRRWMVQTKCADYKVAEVYLRQVAAEAGRINGLEEAANAEQPNGDDVEQGHENEDDRIVKEAVQRFKEDEEWERRNPLEKQKKGKRKVGGGGSLVGQLF